MGFSDIFLPVNVTVNENRRPILRSFLYHSIFSRRYIDAGNGLTDMSYVSLNFSPSLVCLSEFSFFFSVILLCLFLVLQWGTRVNIHKTKFVNQCGGGGGGGWKGTVHIYTKYAV
jgi:hypothetical protein